MKEIVQDCPKKAGAKVLHEVAEHVPEEMFGSAELMQLVADMTEALDKELDGVALAAPQVGVPWRLFIVRVDRTLPVNSQGQTLNTNSQGLTLKPEGQTLNPVEVGLPQTKPEIQVYINPEIIKTSRKQVETDEGCLSTRGVYGITKRHEKVTVRARRADGSRFQRGGSGLMAQIFEHEIDHLNGVLFTEKAERLVQQAHEPNA